PNEKAYGTTDAGVNFSGQLYSSAESSAKVIQSAAVGLRTMPSAGVAAAATSPATPTTLRLICPFATGLSSRAAVVSRPASSQSLVQPTASWVARIVAATATIPAGR